MQAQIACVLGLVTCHLNQSRWQQAAARVKKVIRKGLKRARSLLSGIRSLTGNTILRWVELTSTEEQLTKLFTSVISHQLGGRRVVFKFDWEKKMGKVRWNNWQQFPWTKELVSRTATLLFDNACILTSAIFAICKCYCEASCSNPGQTRLTSDELDFISWVFRSLECFRMVQSQWFCLLA